jgi:hypothetical protein
MKSSELYMFFQNTLSSETFTKFDNDLLEKANKFENLLNKKNKENFIIKYFKKLLDELK